MDKDTRDILEVFGGGPSRKKDPYVATIKSVKNGIAKLDNGVSIDLKRSGKKLKAKKGDQILVVQTGGNPVGVNIEV